jgi:hypothetical protein
VWPGSAQTALVFVGLPLVAALVLMAAPLHDATAPPIREEAPAALAAEAELAERPVVEPAATPASTERHAAVPRRRRGQTEVVPAVIFETRRILPASNQPLPPSLSAESRPVPSIVGRTGPPRPGRAEPQSP